MTDESQDPDVERSAFGISRLRERLRLFGGGLQVTSRPGGGITAVVNLPVPEEVGE